VPEAQAMMLKMAMMALAHNYATKKTRVIKVIEVAITTTTKTDEPVHSLQRPSGLRSLQGKDEGIQKDPQAIPLLVYETPKMQ
jgi:hypothetical protein